MDSTISKRKRWLILFNVSLSIFMATLDGSIVNIALPVISSELSVNISAVQWVVTSYLLTISASLLVWGKIADIYGRKRIFAFGFIIFTLGSMLCGISNRLDMLVFSRVLQAVGAASMMALSQGIVTSVFPPQERGRALGITGTVVAIGSLMGPSLGGILVHAAGWQSIFLINIPIGIIGTALTFFIIPDIQEQPDSKAFDYKGSIMFLTGLVLLFLGLLLFQEGTLSVGLLVPMVVTSVIILFFFIKYERRAEYPLIQLALFKNRIFSIGVICAYLSFVAIFATMLFIPFYLQYVLKFNTQEAGLLVSFYPITTAMLAPVSGWLSDKITYRPLTVTGLTINTLCLAGLATLGPEAPRLKIILLMIGLGLGVAVFQSPNNSSIMGSVPRNLLGIAGGINALFRNLGMVSGITLSVMLFSMTTKMDINKLSGDVAALNNELFLRGFRTVLISASAVCLVSAIISLSRALDKRFTDNTIEILSNTKPETK